MDQPPGSLDDLQPEDLSTSSIATVIDLTRKGEECATSPDTLRMVKSSSWYPNLAPERDSSSDITLQSGDQIQPDNAFSHTTVTLSYVRSHLSTHDSLSRHSPLCGVPAISKLPLHPPCDSDDGLGEASYALNQHYLEQVDGPVDLATQTELFQSSSQAQVEPGNDVLTHGSHEVNGGVCSSDCDTDDRVQSQEEHSLSREDNRALENGRGDSWSSSGVCAESSPETLTPTIGEDEETRGSEVLFVISKKGDQNVVPDSLGARDLCSLSREYISPLDDPVSPSTTSQDDVEDVFVLPQASSSPSGDNSYLETMDEVAWDGVSTEGANRHGSGISNITMTSDCSDEKKQPVKRQKVVLGPLIDLTGDACVSDDSGTNVTPHLNGNAKALQRALKERKLPLRSGRGTRLEAIVMNINSSRYEVSRCIHTSKKAHASQLAASNTKSARAKSKDPLTVGKRTSRAKVALSVDTAKETMVIPVKRGKTNNINTDSYMDSTSDSKMNNSKNSQSSTPPKSLQLAVDNNSKKQPEQHSNPDPSVENYVASVPPPQTPPPPPPSKSPKKSQGKGKAAGSKVSPTAKTMGARTPKRRRKKHKRSQSSSMFSPKEPEIKLRYINYKEEKRDLRSDSFSPFIRVERQQLSAALCTVINYPEEVRTQHKKGQQVQPAGFISAAVPSTSCLQLGRVSINSQHQRSLVCCLCGLSANAMDLGDLHGPYYPEGYQLTTKTPASMSGLKEDGGDYSDSDSSSCSIRDRRRKHAVPHTPRPLRPGAQLKERSLPLSQRWTSEGTDSPAAKRARSDAGSADAEDWYSPPVLPLEPCEYWLHEDCGIWSAGVFLVKGKVYGLEEAVKVARETVKLFFKPMDRFCYHLEMWLI